MLSLILTVIAILAVLSALKQMFAPDDDYIETEDFPTAPAPEKTAPSRSHEQAGQGARQGR